MKKIGIITLNGYFNYGNRLQNYALQEILKVLGFEVETILVDTSVKYNDIAFGEVCKRLITSLWNRLIRRKVEKSKKERMVTFKEFSDRYIRETDFCISNDKIPDDLSDRYDYFVTGSDQVWNPLYIQNSSIYFLTFAPPNKRIAYAPSFGISHIPPIWLEDYKLWLSEMASLSVREEAGAEIIRSLTRREATVLVDPTLLLTKEKWLEISRESAYKPKENYLLTYFLGEQTKDRENMIQDISKENNLTIINLSDIEDEKRYSADPGEFIDYIYSSSVLFTDSFHGCVFSILLEKPFVVFERNESTPSMISRIDTLLSTFQLHSRKWSKLEMDKIFQIDYSHLASILEFERTKAICYLQKALNQI